MSLCAASAAVQPLPFILRHSLLSTLQRPWPTSRCHYDTGSGCCVLLLHRSICRLQCYLEAASGWFNLFDVPHQWRTVVLHYTAITCSRCSTAVGRRYLDTDGHGRSRSVGIGAGIGEIITDADTKPIPVVSADTRYRYRSQPNLHYILFIDVIQQNAHVLAKLLILLSCCSMDKLRWYTLLLRYCSMASQHGGKLYVKNNAKVMI